MPEKNSLESSSICMQHMILVTSVIGCILTLMGVLFGAHKWWHYIPIGTAVFACVLGVPAAYKLNANLLIAFAVFDGADFLLKVFNIGSLIFYKVKITEDCSPFDLSGSEEDCPQGNWRLIILNITSGIVFLIFAAINEIILFTFSIYLTYTVKKYAPQIYFSYGSDVSLSHDVESENSRDNNKVLRRV